MRKREVPPAPKPDHIRALRDHAANLVRAFDRTALDYEGAATADLTERVACLVALHELEGTEPELTKTPTANLRSRLNLLRQVARVQHDEYSLRHLTNGELKRRLGGLDEAIRTEAAIETVLSQNIANLVALTDDDLTDLLDRVNTVIKERKRAAKAAVKDQAKAPALRVVTEPPSFIPDDEEDADVADMIGGDEAA